MDFNSILTSHAKAQSAAQPRSYKGWAIQYDLKPIPIRDCDWTATHPDYDASFEGPEDGWVDNGLKATAASLGELCAEIDAIEQERDLK